MRTENADPLDNIRTLGDIARVHGQGRPAAVAMTF